MKSEAITLVAALAGVSLAMAATAAAAQKAAAPANTQKSRPTAARQVDAAGFDRDVKPILKNTCSGCHNSIVMSGGANLLPYTDPATILNDREAWEKIVQKVQSGEMPPKGAPRPPQEKLDAMVKFVRAQFDKADSAVKPDPGRVTARRFIKMPDVADDKADDMPKAEVAAEQK